MSHLSEEFGSQSVRNRLLRLRCPEFAGLDDVIGSEGRRDLDDVERCEVDAVSGELGSGGLCGGDDLPAGVGSFGVGHARNVPRSVREKRGQK
jgi:hypothetical protein